MTNAPRPPPTTDALNQRICEQLVQREVGACVSPLISHFARNYEALRGSGHNWEDDVLPLCEQEGIDEPFRSEACEHWIVSEWLGGELGARGEMVGELFGLTVWGRATTGQAISMDSVVVLIASEVGTLIGQPNQWAVSIMLDLP